MTSSDSSVHMVLRIRPSGIVRPFDLFASTLDAADHPRARDLWQALPAPEQDKFRQQAENLRQQHWANVPRNGFMKFAAEKGLSTTTGADRHAAKAAWWALSFEDRLRYQDAAEKAKFEYRASLKKDGATFSDESSGGDWPFGRRGRWGHGHGHGRDGFFGMRGPWGHGPHGPGPYGHHHHHPGRPHAGPPHGRHGGSHSHSGADDRKHRHVPGSHSHSGPEEGSHGCGSGRGWGWGSRHWGRHGPHGSHSHGSHSHGEEGPRRFQHVMHPFRACGGAFRLFCQEQQHDMTSWPSRHAAVAAWRALPDEKRQEYKTRAGVTEDDKQGKKCQGKGGFVKPFEVFCAERGLALDSKDARRAAKLQWVELIREERRNHREAATAAATAGPSGAAAAVVPPEQDASAAPAVVATTSAAAPPTYAIATSAKEKAPASEESFVVVAEPAVKPFLMFCEARGLPTESKAARQEAKKLWLSLSENERQQFKKESVARKLAKIEEKIAARKATLATEEAATTPAASAAASPATPTAAAPATAPHAGGPFKAFHIFCMDRKVSFATKEGKRAAKAAWFSLSDADRQLYKVQARGGPAAAPIIAAAAAAAPTTGGEAAPASSEESPEEMPWGRHHGHHGRPFRGHGPGMRGFFHGPHPHFGGRGMHFGGPRGDGPRTRTAFSRFLEDFRLTHDGNGNVFAAAARQWKELDESDRKPYEDAYAADLAKENATA